MSATAPARRSPDTRRFDAESRRPLAASQPPFADSQRPLAERRRPLADPRRSVVVRLDAVPAGPYRLPARNAPDGVLRCRTGVVHRLMHDEGLPVIVAATQTAPGSVHIAARARSREAAARCIERMRFALGLDVEVASFLLGFKADPFIGASVRRRPWLRVMRRPEPFEALAWAICEQLIEYRRAAAIERRIVFKLGRSLGAGGASLGPAASPRAAGGSLRAAPPPRGAVLRDLPTPAVLAGVPPALLQSFDLGASRAQALVRVATEVACGRIDLDHADHERCWRRLRAIPGIGAWTVEMLALHGQGREDQVPAGDVGLLRLVGRLLGGGDPRAFAEERHVRDFFAPYEEWKGLACAHLLAA